MLPHFGHLYNFKIRSFYRYNAVNPAQRRKAPHWERSRAFIFLSSLFHPMMPALPPARISSRVTAALMSAMPVLGLRLRPPHSCFTGGGWVSGSGVAGVFGVSGSGGGVSLFVFSKMTLLPVSILSSSRVNARRCSGGSPPAGCPLEIVGSQQQIHRDHALGVGGEGLSLGGSALQRGRPLLASL